MDKLRKSGDSVGAKISCGSGKCALVGWGEPVYDRLDAEIAYAMMSINAVKGVEIGAGFTAVVTEGTEHSDEITAGGFLSNNAGGIVGGISTGQDIVVNIAIKPTSSIRLERRSVDKTGKPADSGHHGRHDPCVGIRATPIAEAMLALVLMDMPASPCTKRRCRVYNAKNSWQGGRLAPNLMPSTTLSGAMY